MTQCSQLPLHDLMQKELALSTVSILTVGLCTSCAPLCSLQLRSTPVIIVKALLWVAEECIEMLCV